MVSTKGELVAALAQWDDDTPIIVRCKWADGLWLEGDRIDVGSRNAIELVLYVSDTEERSA